jgi:hypothetical protein
VPRAQSSGVQTSVGQASCSEITWSPAPNVCRSEYHLQALYSGVNGPMQSKWCYRDGLEYLSYHEEFEANSIAYARYTSCCKHRSVSGRIAHAQTRPGQLDRLQPASGERCARFRNASLESGSDVSVDNTNSYASCASIFTDKFCDDPHGFGKKVTGKCFCPKMPFERSLVDWDMDGPINNYSAGLLSVLATSAVRCTRSCVSLRRVAGHVPDQVPVYMANVFACHSVSPLAQADSS